jgi:hypothetical protein
MRLIHCNSLQFEEFFNKNIPRYAILSHTWGNEEVSFAEFTLYPAVPIIKQGIQKILFTCEQALRDELEYAWVDTCCIDKASSSDVSESINSMFNWYRDAHTCYVYLSDVSKSSFEKDFPACRWFKRGWTLQELLAPRDAMFYDRAWDELGTRSEHIDKISEITMIDREVLITPTCGKGVEIRLESFCVAKRMSWASCRETSRAEDIAYCLLGIFGINMPVLYGEGQRAFVRLQEEIIRTIDDDSVLAWSLDAATRHPVGIESNSVPAETEISLSGSPILANSPADFGDCGDFEYAAERDAAFGMTNGGLQIQLPLVPVSAMFPGISVNTRNGYDSCIGLLSCTTGTNSGLLGIILLTVGKYGSSTHMIRTHILSDDEPCFTVVVGPRVAAQSFLQNVTIIRERESLKPRNSLLGCRQIIMNQSKAFLETGYHVRSGTGLNIAENRHTFGYNLVWDPVALVLSIEGQHITKDLLSFCFRPQWSTPGPSFTIFMRTATKRAIVRKGASFTKEDKHAFYNYLESQHGKDSADSMIITSSEGNSLRVVVLINEKKVYNRQIIEADVDVVQVIAGL